MICGNCGTELKEDALFCHKCGAKISAASGDADTDDAVREEVPSDEEKKEQADPSYDNVRSDAVSETSYDEYFTIDEEEDKKKRKTYITGAIVAVVFVCFICFCASNTFKRTFYSPANYYRYVEKKNASKKTDLITGWYGLASSLVPGGGSVGSEGSLRIHFSEDILNDMADTADIYGISDYSWLEDISFNSKNTMYDELYGSNLSVALGDNTILTVNSINDEANNKAYIRIPELSDEYIGYNTSAMDEINDTIEDHTGYDAPSADSVSSYMAIARNLPEAARIKKLIGKYSDIVFDDIVNVERSKKQKLEIGGVTEKCYILSVDLGYKDLKAIAEDIRSSAADDKELKDMIVKTAKEGGGNGEKAWSDFLSLLDDLEDSIGDLSGTRMKVYVDRKGRVIAREIETGDDMFSVKYGRTVDGRTFGAQCVISEYGSDIISIKGSGRKAGQNYAGDFTFGADDMRPIAFTLDSFDYGAFTGQKLKGQITVDVKEISKALELDGSDFDYVNGYKAVMSVDSPGAGTYSTKISLNDGVTEPMVIDHSYKKTGGSRVNVPQDARMIYNAGDLGGYIKEADWQTVKNNLRSADVPDNVIKSVDSIQMAADYLQYLFTERDTMIF